MGPWWDVEGTVELEKGNWIVSDKNEETLVTSIHGAVAKMFILYIVGASNSGFFLTMEGISICWFMKH